MGALHDRPDVQIAWLLVVVLAIGGYAAFVAPLARRAEGIAFHAHDLYDVANRNEQYLKSIDRLREARRRVDRDTKMLSSESSAAMTTLETLRLLQLEERRWRVRVLGVAPSGRDDTPNAAGSEDVNVSLRGTYRSILETVADLSRHRVLLEILDATLAAGSSDPGGRAVDATLHATLYYRIAAIMKDDNHAPLLPR